MDLSEFNTASSQKKKANKSFFQKLKSNSPRNLDDLFQEAHYKTFESTDCLKCANCCKTTSPVFYERDIDRAAKALRTNPGTFIHKYLTIDEDNDYVLKQSPCAFLGSENYCTIYADRPAACREYPHTNRKNIRQILDLTYRNTLVCPAVLKITEEVRQKLGL
jgi:Fe-S-cluster containining protein